MSRRFIKKVKSRNKRINSEEIILIESAKLASSKAIRSSIALGLTIKIIENNKIIEKSASGKTTVIREIPKSNIDLKDLKKGMILCRK